MAAPAPEGTSAGQASGPDKLTLTYVTSPLNVPTIIERDQNIFADAFEDMGISLEYAEINSGADQTQALASGDVQILYAVGATSVILSAANGADIKVLNMYSRSPKAFCIYSTDDSLTTPESLKGKTIAGPEKNRDVIGRFVEAQKGVAAFMEDNQDEALQIVAEELDLDEEAVREMYACYDFSMDVTDEDKKGFQKTADFMLESGMIEEELNVNSLFL
ncbi:ABC transporter substrate-binding protein [Enterocloster clostridioformis]|nr:ABC transporter substrate-binding protein [Enterocloster clostridioformis]QQR03864.1 ABC transporter substrate-binding protein [Enterocloster clostridioformis]